MELAYTSVDTSSLRGSGMRAPSGRHVLHGNLKSGCEFLAIAGVSNFAKMVLRLVPAAFERPHHQPTPRPFSLDCLTRRDNGYTQ